MLPAERHGRARARAVSRHEILIEGHPESRHTADRGHRQRRTGSTGICGPTRAERSPPDARIEPEAAGGVLQPLVLPGLRRNRSAADGTLRGSRRAVRLRRHRRRRHAAVSGTPHCAGPLVRAGAPRGPQRRSHSPRVGHRAAQPRTFTRTDVELPELLFVGVAGGVPARTARCHCRADRSADRRAAGHRDGSRDRREVRVSLSGRLSGSRAPAGWISESSVSKPC